MFRATPRSGGQSRGRFGAVAQTPVPGQISLGRISLTNTGGASLQPRARLGMAWTKGRFPATHSLRVRVDGGADVAFAALVGRNSYSDGSIRSTADGGIVIHDTTSLAASASRTYEVYAVAGTQGTSGFDPWAWITAHANDFTVEITSRTGSSTGAMGNLTFGLKAAIGDTTRREIVSDTPRFVRTKVWQKLSGEEHLICEFHHDFWLDGAGNVVGIEWTPVLTQHWWVANPFGVTQAKERQDYTATVKYGATAVDTRTGLQHAYHCRWASLRTDNDAQHARKHWINVSGAPMPTIRVRYADATLREMMRAGAVPPVGNNLPLPATARTYAPLATQGHSSSIAGVGDYAGRGIWCIWASNVLLHQGGGSGTNPDLAWREARVTAQAGLSYNGHHRDHRLVDGAVRNRAMPLPFRRISGGTQSYAGLGAPVVHSRSSTPSAAPYSTLAFGSVNGGTGAFNSADGAHAVNYSGPMAFLEGEKYLGDATLGQFIYNTTASHWNEIGYDRGLLANDRARGPIWGIPSSSNAANRYGALGWYFEQDRAFAWAANLLAAQYLVTDDRDPAYPYILNHALNANALFSDSFAYLPAEARAYGHAFVVDQQGVCSPWMSNFRVMTFYFAHLALKERLPVNPRGFNGFEEFAWLDARYLKNLAAQGLYHVRAYRAGQNPDADMATFFSDNWYPVMQTITYASSTFTLTDLPLGFASSAVVNGLRVQFARKNGGDNQVAPPSPFTFGTDYWTVNASGASFQLAATPGGSPITFSGSGSGTTAPGIYMSFPAYDRTQIGPSGTYEWPPGNSYQIIGMAAMEMAAGVGHSDYDAAFINKFRTFYAPWRANPPATEAASYRPPWMLDGTLLQEP
jgi:hypothetical protein